MSLPHANTTTFPTLNPTETAEFDVHLLNLAQKSQGDLRRLLYAFFSFLHRRTDFYCVPHLEDLKEGVPIRMGFREGDAEKLLLAAFRQFPLRRMPRQGGKTGGGGPKGGGGGVVKAETKKKNVSPIPQDVAKNDTVTPPPSKNNMIDVTPKNTKPAEKTADPMSNVRLTEEGKQIPEGNGGVTKRYRWTQTLTETSVVVGVPKGTKGKDLTVSIKPSSISITFKNPKASSDNPTVLSGDLVETIRVDESTWSLEGGALLLTLDKVKYTWWDTVLKGDDVIDTSLVDSTRKIGEYDESTQGAIRKILFDQRQERLGLPTSDEILGVKPTIPPLPSGVEYIDQKKMDEVTGKTTLK